MSAAPAEHNSDTRREPTLEIPSDHSRLDATLDEQNKSVAGSPVKSPNDLPGKGKLP